MPLWLKVIASFMLVAAVLWWMWRKPVSDGLYAWAPPMALLSAWVGLSATVLSAALWVLPYPDRWLVLIFLALDPAAGACAILTLWILRAEPLDNAPAQLQRLQAKFGLMLTLAAVTLGYLYVMSHKTPFTPVGS